MTDKTPIDWEYLCWLAGEHCDQLEAENKRLRKVLEACLKSMSHAQIFIQTREKMHPDGLALFKENEEKGYAALAQEKSQ